MNLILKQVPKSYEPKEGWGVVYAIAHQEQYDEGLPALLTAILHEPDHTYVGVTANRIAKRWKDHKALRARDNQLTSHFIRDYEYEFEQCFRVIFEGKIDQCYRLEYHLRQAPNTGLNKKVGGKLEHRKLNRHYLNMIDRALNG